MNRKIALFILLGIILYTCNTIKAQRLSPQMQAVYDACLQMRSSIGSGNLPGLRAANEAFKLCNSKEFGALRCITQNPLTLDGHFVFDEVFVDSLIDGRKVYEFAQRYADKRRVRGTSSSGTIFDKTCAVKKKSSVKYTLPTKGRQELAIVTESGGLVSLRIHDKTHNKWFNDTDEGKPSRYKVIDLPKNERSILEIEIINTSDKDISFVILGN